MRNQSELSGFRIWEIAGLTSASIEGLLEELVVLPALLLLLGEGFGLPV